MPLPSLRGALATKQSRGRVMRPLDCFAALAMAGGELARLFLGVALGLSREPQGARCMVDLTHPTVALPTWRIVAAAAIGNVRPIGALTTKLYDRTNDETILDEVE